MLDNMKNNFYWCLEMWTYLIDYMRNMPMIESEVFIQKPLIWSWINGFCILKDGWILMEYKWNNDYIQESMHESINLWYTWFVIKIYLHRMNWSLRQKIKTRAKVFQCSKLLDQCLNKRCDITYNYNIVNV